MYRRRVRHRFWILLTGAFILWLVLGFTLDPNDIPLNDVFDVATLTVFFASLLFVILYTVVGFIGEEPRSRWWRNKVGTALVLTVGSIMFVVGPFAAAVLFNDGQINTWWWAWIWLGGHALAAFTLLMLNWLWIQNFKSIHES